MEWKDTFNLKLLFQEWEAGEIQDIASIFGPLGARN